MTEVVLIAGGNLGDVEGALRTALGKVGERIGRIVQTSGIYASEAWGFDAPQRFLNQVWIVETTLEPEAVLDLAQQIEREAGRTEKSAGGVYRSRTMDIDLLFYGDRVIRTPRLTVPHPLMERRRFVMEPLCEIMPGRTHPVSGQSMRELLGAPECK